MVRKKKNYSRLWTIDLNITGHPFWIHRSGVFYKKNYDKVRITKKTISRLKDAKVCICLINMHIETEQYKSHCPLIPTIKMTHIICDDIKFLCTNKPEYSVWTCIDNMRKGKCPYKIAKLLFPDSYKQR